MKRFSFNLYAARIAKMTFMGVFFAVLVFSASQLPKFGDPHSPAATQVSPHYIEKGYEETGGPNMVTDVLADYRSLDTLFETAVIFTSALSCLLILGFRRDASI